MIQIDGPHRLRLGELTAVLDGWYAGVSPCQTISVRAGGVEIACRLQDRMDVRQAYPHLFSQGFRCPLDFLHLEIEMENDELPIQVAIDGGESATVRIAVETGWCEDVRALRASQPRLAPGEDLGLGLGSGGAHYRAYVGLPEHYDLTAASTFNLMTLLGLRQHHRLVDIGCGSLRTGRLLIPYLNSGNYLGVEPNEWLVHEGIRRELGENISSAKRPRFLFTGEPAMLDGEPQSHFALANSIFSHASLEQIRQWLQHVALHLTTYGVLAATYVAGDEDYAGADWIYPGCVRYRTETVRALAESCGFRFAPLDWRHLHGQTWAAFAKPKFNLEWIGTTPLCWNAKVDAGRL